MDKKIIYINSMVIGILAVFATASGLFWKGLYKHDTVSGVAQMMGQDLITLIVVVPLLLVTVYLISRASLRGYLMWMGTIFYFLYSYASISFLTSYNQLFLVYVALFSVSLYTFLYGLFSMDVKTIKKSVSQGVTKVSRCVSNNHGLATCRYVAFNDIGITSKWYGTCCT